MRFMRYYFLFLAALSTLMGEEISETKWADAERFMERNRSTLLGIIPIRECSKSFKDAMQTRGAGEGSSTTQIFLGQLGGGVEVEGANELFLGFIEAHFDPIVRMCGAKIINASLNYPNNDCGYFTITSMFYTRTKNAVEQVLLSHARFYGFIGDSSGFCLLYAKESNERDLDQPMLYLPNKFVRVEADGSRAQKRNPHQAPIAVPRMRSRQVQCHQEPYSSFRDGGLGQAWVPVESCNQSNSNAVALSPHANPAYVRAPGNTPTQALNYVNYPPTYSVAANNSQQPPQQTHYTTYRQVRGDNSR